MKTKINVLLATIVLFAFLSGTSCSYDNELALSNTKSFSIEEAQKILEHNLSQRTRTTNETFGYDVGEFIPNWKASVVSGSNTLYSIDVPIESELSFIVDYDSVFVRTHSQLVVVKNATTENTGCYIRTTIPSLEYAKTHTMDDIRTLTNKGIQGDFSGHIIYSTMDGIPYYIAQCVNGEVKLFADISNPDNLDSELSITQYMLRGLKLVRINNATTRSDSVPIEEIVIVYNPENRSTTNIDVALARYLVQYLRALEFEGEQNENPGVNIGGGGGWNPGNNNQEILYPNFEIYRNNILIWGNEISTDTVVRYLNYLDDNFPIYKQLLSEFNNQNININIEWDPDYEYVAGLDANDKTLIKYSSVDNPLIFLEELIHVYQYHNHRYIPDVEYEFEAKYILAECLIIMGFTANNLNNNNNLEYGYPSIRGAKFDIPFWQKYINYINSNSVELRDSIYKDIDSIGYKDSPNYLGALLRNYFKLKLILIL